MQASQLLSQEKQDVQALMADIKVRRSYYKLAETMERQGATEEARTLYRSIVPHGLAQRHAIPMQKMCSREEAWGVERLCVFPGEVMTLAPPRNKDENRKEVFKQTEIRTGREFVDSLHSCSIAFDGFHYLVADRDGLGISNYSTPNGYILGSQRDDASVPSIDLPGNTLLLSHHSSCNFYHWMYELLPKFGQLAPAGIDATDIDHVLIDDNLSSFHYQSLEALGIPAFKVVVLPHAKVNVTCENLLIAPIIGQLGLAHSGRHLNWLKSAFLNRQKRMPRHERLVIHRDVRGFHDQELVYATLRGRGYTILDMAGMQFLEQVAAFAHAKHVVGAHGAGLSSLVFCRPDTRVHEFYGNYVHPCFWAASSLTGLSYHNYNGNFDADDSDGHSALRNPRKTPVSTEREWLEGV